MNRLLTRAARIETPVARSFPARYAPSARDTKAASTRSQT
ncbi:hypothetical protein RAS1_23180 [Phycisphaerae bacterium RAS1]|nr:hypothetical protein RAS1_23180 [Phycisphaerae bacterium RAS1]